MGVVGLIDKTLRPYKGAVYRLGLAMPEPDYETATGRQLFTVSQIERLVALAVMAERDACAKECDSLAAAFMQQARGGDNSGASDHMAHASEQCADAIRERYATTPPKP